ncbi:MAG: polyhydroxyalkanoate synthesis regulator DNA-binding domain-containing protein [Deltaproteobacteria bacterium]|nr:polyhydroxyalkanoate synthesis regulator DNA-binding domain-containing protein [Deltaproteobacteria bacterium]
MPKVIKRYQNRKLYDTEDSCYVTLEDIRDMIKQGEDVQIIDNATKEDLTSVTLAQIILEAERKQKGLLPINTFKQIIQSGGEVLKGIVQDEFKRVRTFVDKQIKPTVESVQSIPTVASEIRQLKSKIEALERKLKAYEPKR